jgi:hypothetical protein
MARLTFWVAAAALCAAVNSASAQEAQLRPGVITANNVDITTDAGEVLNERLNVGDTIYIVVGPKKERKGWVRISRSPDDQVGIGWIEDKNVRSYDRWAAQPSSAPAPAPAGAAPGGPADDLSFLSEEAGASADHMVAVLPFTSASPKDPLTQRAQEAFSKALRENGGFNIPDGFSAPGVNPESVQALKSVVEQKNLDGVFVGSVSPPLGGARLLKVRYFKRSEGEFVSEKVKRLPEKGDLARAIDELVASFVQELKSR